MSPLEIKEQEHQEQQQQKRVPDGYDRSFGFWITIKNPHKNHKKVFSYIEKFKNLGKYLRD